jgi:Cys-tRNA(Pro)/Cys-tRNA(Cys) deacylase
VRRFSGTGRPGYDRDGMSDSKKTNAMRILESLGISYEAAGYDYNDETPDAVSAAAALGVEPEIVFKTLVCEDDKHRLFVFCLPAPCELNMKKAARAAGRRVELVKVKELFNLTGYVRGGCSPLGMKKKFPTFIEESARLFERIYVNAGRQGGQVILAPDDLLRACDGRCADLI